ncbi:MULTISPECIES: ABC transporter ATP-binding protein [unclassified Fusibacter]|uniref:ABC transporter ATP-binding protein n=1 Tax=unclassified Fusibacter TaxID=2624464 RepID=UPI0010116079|nr:MULTISPECIES: ABC transporter ATP-binding protein [unclassified Fusibacter]MCK8061348.1 ABC transporter ATP-binding protein/permease [Fusibacter sp. A2]NPE23609.1 ABC transporter ATP-binding protein [Fusibacter sp. A1]RXV59017.1 ABC transporter ATP-binding protein [Fusibacter sp. A1]
MENKEQFSEKKIEKSFDLKLFMRLMRYAKPHALLLGICLILLVVVTLVEVANPFLIKVAIDDIINPTEKVYGVYDEHSDITTLSYEGRNYSSLSYRLIEPDDKIRVIRSEDKLYWVPYHYDLSKGYDIEVGTDTAYLSTENSIYKAHILTDEFQAALDEHAFYNLSQLALGFFLLLVVGFVFNYGQVILLNWTSQKIIFKMREDLFSHIMNLDLTYFEKNPVGRLVTRITNDLDNINEMYTSVLLTVLKDLMMVISIVVIMLLIDVKLTLVCLASFPLVVAATWLFRIKIREVQRKIKLQIAIINSKLSEYISGMNIIQIFGVEKKYYDDFEVSNHDYKDTLLSEIRIFGVFRPAMSFIYSIGLVMLLLYGSSKVLNQSIELGVLIAFTRYIKQFYQPIFDFSEKFNIMQSAMASAERLFVIQETRNPIENPIEPKRVKKIKGDIQFKNVWFSYNENEPVLKDVSFEIKAGETIAIVGHTGSGKTTITSLINRFYDIQKGDILIDGISIKDFDKEKLRSHIGMVLQDVYLFSSTISENIRMYNKDISKARIEEAARVVNAKLFIDKQHEGFEYKLKERGNEFSTGQRQLLSFARALAYNPEIMILDEATSNIDTETEELIQDAILKLANKRTTIVIAHRLSTIKNADKIIVLNKGEVKEIGNHDELISKGGLYYDLYRLQYSEADAEEII